MRETISKCLLWSLLLLGAITLIVFAAPNLITVGLFLLILPGLFLGITPTLFLYLMAFSIPWFCLNHRGIPAGVVAGLAGIAWVGWAVPTLLNLQTTEYRRQAEAKELTPSGTLNAPRVIALSRGRHQTRTCDPMCQMLLYRNGVERVVYLPAQSSFHIEKQQTCPDSDKLLQGNHWYFGDTSSSSKTITELKKYVRLRIAGGECLVTGDASSEPPEWELQQVEEDIGSKPDSLALRSGHVHVEAFQILVQGKVHARQSRIDAHPFSIPLMLEPYGGSELQMYGFRFNRQGRRLESLDALPFLERFTSLNLDAGTTVESKTLRAQIDAALNDPTLPAMNGGFAVVKDYFDEIREKGARSEDVARLARLISDERVLQFDWLPVHKLSYGQKQTLLDPILDRLVRMASAGNLRPYYTLAIHLRQIPETAFRNPDPRIDRLLAKLETRRNSAALIKAVAFRGPAEADRLLSFVAEGSQQNSRERIDHFGDDVDAALRGLCHLGVSAQKVLPKMHEMAAAGSVSAQRQESDLWRATLIALGENVEQFELPRDRKWRTDLYRRSLSRMAEKRCEER